MTIKTTYTSHRDDERGGQKAPDHAHMAFHGHGEGIHDLTAMPRGTHLFFIEDPRRADTILEVILDKVEFENHVFKGLRCWAFSKSMNSTRTLFLTAAWGGEYKSALTEQSEENNARLAQQAKGGVK